MGFNSGLKGLIVPSIFWSHIFVTLGDEYLKPSNCCRCIFSDIILSNNSCHFYSASLSWRQAVKRSPLFQFAVSRGPRLLVQRSTVNVFLLTVLKVVSVCPCNICRLTAGFCFITSASRQVFTNEICLKKIYVFLYICIYWIYCKLNEHRTFWC
jgi:hypothetical protein